MGEINISTYGSFPVRTKTFSAFQHGHAHATAEAIQFLTTVILPWAIEKDHELQEEEFYPEKGFIRPKEFEEEAKKK